MINMDTMMNITRNTVIKLMIENKVNKEIEKKVRDATRRKRACLKNAIH
jgi:hypothetical protein